MEIFTLAGLAALVLKFTSFSKYVTNKDWNGAVTQLWVWAVGILVAFLACAANMSEQIVVAGKSLGSFDGPSTVLFGLGLASFGSVGFDFIKSRTDSPASPEPSLVPQKAA